MTETLNTARILGHLGADPKLSLTRDGKEIAQMRIATNEGYRDKEGNRQERTEWHRVVVFSPGLVEKVIKPYLKKGSCLYLEGSLRTTSYSDKNGDERYSTEIVVELLRLLDPKPAKAA